jgi:hypothetical protein
MLGVESLGGVVAHEAGLAPPELQVALEKPLDEGRLAQDPVEPRGDVPNDGAPKYSSPTLRPPTTLAWLSTEEAACEVRGVERRGDLSTRAPPSGGSGRFGAIGAISCIVLIQKLYFWPFA